MTFWKEGAGRRVDDMATQAAALLQSEPADVASLPSFVPTEAADYGNCFATLTACSILDMRANAQQLLENDATEHVYQLNHVYVPVHASKM